MTDISIPAVPGNPPAQDYRQAYAHINAITQVNADTAVVDFRAIHDADRARPAIPFRATLQNAWSSIVHYNSTGYGIFIVVSQLDGIGRELANVVAIRAHYIDLDNPLTAPMSLDRARGWYPPPSFGVQTSNSKFHVYWIVQPYAGLDRFQLVQRKLVQLYQSDKAITDATRVLRLAGTFNTKYSNPASDKHVLGAQPYLVTCFGLGGKTQPVEILEAALASVNVIESGGGTRHELGDPSMAAPSLAWLQYGLDLIDPNALDRGKWVACIAAFKQAGWTLASEPDLFDMWSKWCARYEKNDIAENNKQWASFRQTEIGWPWLVRNAPGLQARLALDAVRQPDTPLTVPGGASVPPQPGGGVIQRLVMLDTHHDAATAFAIQHKDRFVFNASIDAWYCWRGTHWQLLLDSEFLGIVRQFCVDVATPEHKRPRNANYWEGVKKTLETMPEFSQRQEAFNNDNYLLNTPSGTIDLRTDTVQPAQPQQFITRISNASPGQGTGAWPKFVDEIMNGDADSITTLQTMAGASLSGATEEHWFAFFYGQGRNGKSQFAEAIKWALGTYATALPSAMITTAHNEQHPTGLTGLAGARFAISSEVPDGAYFHTQRLKELTGDETVQARLMIGNWFEFRRQFKLWIVGNDAPQIRTVDTAIRSRLIIVPFNVSFRGREDPDLASKLRADGCGIMNWLLEGHAAWLRAGKRLRLSGAIQHATAAYFAAQSTPEMWLAECAKLINPDMRLQGEKPTASMLYRSYVSWKTARGEVPISQTRFGIWLQLQPGVSKFVGIGVQYSGIEFRTPTPPAIA